MVEDKLAGIGPSLQVDNEDDDLGLGLSREQNVTVRMICYSTSTGWKAALRKILVIVYGHEVLAMSCVVGRTNANSTPALDSRKLDIVKGIHREYEKLHIYMSVYTHYRVDV